MADRLTGWLEVATFDTLVVEVRSPGPVTLRCELCNEPGRVYTQLQRPLFSPGLNRITRAELGPLHAKLVRFGVSSDASLDIEWRVV